MPAGPPASPARVANRQDRRPLRMTRLTRHLYFWVLLAILAGGTLGYVRPDIGVALKPLGDGFIALVKMLISPIIFCTVVLGIAGAGDMKKVGRVGGKALLYFEVVSTLRAGHRPGRRQRDSSRAPASTSIRPRSTPRGGRLRQDGRRASPPCEFLLHIIPRTFFDAFTGSGDLLQVLLRRGALRLRDDAHGQGGQRRAPVHRDLLARLLRDDERADEAGAARRRRRDGLHHRPLRRRLAASRWRC